MDCGPSWISQSIRQRRIRENAFVHSDPQTNKKNINTISLCARRSPGRKPAHQPNPTESPGISRWASVVSSHLPSSDPPDLSQDPPSRLPARPCLRDQEQHVGAPLGRTVFFFKWGRYDLNYSHVFPHSSPNAWSVSLIFSTFLLDLLVRWLFPPVQITPENRTDGNTFQALRKAKAKVPSRNVLAQQVKAASGPKLSSKAPNKNGAIK